MAYKALIVGVNTLGLKYCARDAQRLSESLGKYGYESILLGIDKPRLQTAFDSMVDDAAQTDTLLLYFSGHGLPEKGKLWFFLSDEASKLANKLNVNEWLQNFSDCRASNKLVILDCCHAGQGIVELRLELSDRYLVLAASERLEKSIELEALQASFFTHHLCQVLDDPPQQLLEGGQSLSVQNLHKWLLEEAQKHNGQNAIQVPIPKLFGSHADFALAILPSDEAYSALKATAEAQRLQAVEQRYRKLLLDTCDIVSLANLPEQDRHLATHPLELRRLYVPLHVWVDFRAGEKTKETEWEEIEKRRATGMGAPLGTEALRRERQRASVGAPLGTEAPRRERQRASVGAPLGTEAPRRERQRASVGVRLAEARRLVVLGDPGAGKTTLTRWIATAYLLRLKGDANWQDLPDVKTLPDADWLPIIVRCRDLDLTCLTGTLDDILSYTLRKAEMETSEADVLQRMLRERLQAGSALLMLDGLDEITDPKLRAGFCQQLERIHLAHPAASIIATSRIVGYREMGYRLERGFEHVTLADLEPEEKDDFARRWCDLTELPERRAEATRELIRDTHSTDRIERMTGNPMLLTTMALVKRKVGKLPSRRAELYGEAVQVLLNWRREVDEPLDPYEAIPQLEYVAYAMCDRGVQRLRRDEILILINRMRADYPNVHQAHNHTPEEFLSRLEARTGLLVEAGRTRHLGLEAMVYEFRHLTFQEYLAARALVDGRFPSREAGQSLASHVAPLAGRTAETAFTQKGDKEVAVMETWREVLRLCVAICRDDDVDSTLRAILTPLESEPEITSRARAILATLCISDEPNVSEVIAREVFEIFSSQVQKEDRNFEVKTGVHVAAVSVAETRWAMLLCQCLVTEFSQQDPLCRDYWGDIAGLVYAKSAPSKTGALSTWWANQTKILQDETEFQATQAALGIAAMAATRQTAQITPELISSLLVRLTGSAPMAHAAAEALAQLHAGLIFDGWRPNPKHIEQFTGFINTCTNDPEAVRFLACILGYEKVVAAVDSLLNWLNHRSIDLRHDVADVLGRIGSERAVEPLLARLEDADAGVRGAAAGALGNLKSERAVEPLLARLEDADAEVRGAAAWALGNLKSERAVEPLLARLEDADAEVRGAAAWALGNLKSERAVEPLLARLEDADAEVRGAAAGALSSLKSERAVEPLLARLEDADAEVRGAAAGALSSLKSERAVESLLARLEDADAEVRRAVAGMLGNLKSERAVESLIARLEDADAEVRGAAAGALSSLKSERAVEPLLARLEDADAEVRGAAAWALGNLESERAVEPLLARLEDADAGVRGAAAWALSSLESECAVEPLIARLEDADAGVRGAAAWALSSLESECAVEPLLARLEDADAGVRGAAAWALSILKSERAVEPLIARLEDADAGVRGAASGALSSLESERAVEPLLARLEDADAEVRRAAAGALSSLESERAVEPLLARLEDADAEVRRAAAGMLGNLKSERAVESLIARLEDADAEVRRAAAGALSSLESECAVEPLLARLEDIVAKVRRAAAEALGNLKSERAVEPLIARLEDADPEMRGAAAEALGNLKSERAVEPLIARLEDADARVRRAAAGALSSLKSERAVEPLIARLEDADPEMRGAAAGALSSLKSERAVEPLLARLEDADAKVRRAAAGALGNIGSERAVEPLLARLEDADAEVRRVAAGVLGNIGSERAVEPLLARLEDADAEVRGAAAGALSSLKSERAVEPLLARLEDIVAKVRRAAAWALGNIGSERAVEPLLARLEDADAEMCRAAAGALGNIGSERAVESLLARLEDADAKVRRAAAGALGNIGSERAVEPLLARLEDADAKVRRAAAGALGNIGSERAVESLLARLEDADARVRCEAVEALSCRVEREDRCLLSRDFDGTYPFLDPRETISVQWVNKAARALNFAAEVVRARYEALASQFKLRLSWK